MRLAQSLGFGPGETFRHIEAPMLREILPGVALVILVICLTSFAIVLTLGGGPRATTIELAIYQAVRFDFDLSRAAGLAGVQVLICTLAAALAWVILSPEGFGAGLDREVPLAAPSRWRRAVDAAALVAAALFLLLPLGAIVLRGLPGLFDLSASVLPAAGRSVLVAVTSAALTTGAALALALAAARRRGPGSSSSCSRLFHRCRLPCRLPSWSMWRSACRSCTASFCPKPGRFWPTTGASPTALA
jgi:thiamine transport system permease protein